MVRGWTGPRGARRAVPTARGLGGALALGLLVLSPLAVHAQQAQVVRFRLAGRVLDGATDAPIADATVRVEDLGLSAVTDGNGLFVLDGITAGRHVFVTTHELFHANREASEVERGAILFVRLLARSVPEVATAGGHVLDLEPGAKVRVRLDGGTRSLEAVLRELRPDTLLLGYPPSIEGSTMPVAVAEVDALEVSVGRRSMIPLGAAIGALVGALSVAGYNALLDSQCVFDCDSRTPILVGAGVGALAGGIGFSFIPGERWVAISLPR